MRSLLRILVLLTGFLVLVLGGTIGWNAWRIREIREAFSQAGVRPVGIVDLGKAVPAGEEVLEGPYPFRTAWIRPQAEIDQGVVRIRETGTQKTLVFQPVGSGGPRFGEILEVLRFDPGALSPLCHPDHITRAMDLALKRFGEFGGARISTFEYRGFRGLKVVSGHDALVRVFGPRGTEVLSVSFQHLDPATGEADGILRSLLDSMAEGS